MRTSLETLQQSFANAVLDVNQVEPALALFKGSNELNRKRLVFYRNNVTLNWRDTLLNAYPVLRQLMGEAFFNGVTHAYGLAHASPSGDLGEFGASLASFINTLENCQDYPFFGDVAALEWLVHRAWYLKQATPVTLAQLAAFPPEQLTEQRFKLQESCALLKSPWAVADIWHTLQNTDTPSLPDPLAKTSHCLIWRPYGVNKWAVQVDLISAASFKALQALDAGESLGQALELALEDNPEFEVQSEIANWFSKQLFNEIIQKN
jgi:hypothetical protein